MEYCPDNYDAWCWYEEEQERRKMIDRNEESEDEDG